MNRIKFRRGSLNNKKNIDIEDGEPIYLTDTKRLYVSNEDVAINNVYVGSQEPNDPGINVWIDPQGVNNVIDMIYPIGSIYMSVNDTDPSMLFSGEWEQIKDRFLLCAGDTYVNGSIGGEATHKLTIDEMPTHTHQLGLKYPGDIPNTIPAGLDYTYDGINNIGAYFGTVDAPTAYNNVTGGGQSHNNMPPYLVVYVWKRIA